MGLKLQSFYCYQENGKKVITTKKDLRSQVKKNFYVTACPNREIAARVYERFLAFSTR